MVSLNKNKLCLLEEETSPANSYGNQFEYAVPRLDRIAYVKLASIFWRSTFRTSNRRENANVCDKCCYESASETVNQLAIPESCKEKLLLYVNYLDKQANNWFLFYEKATSIVMSKEYYDICLYLHWSSNGTIDYIKSAERILNDDEVAVMMKHVLACIYCFENEIVKSSGKYLFQHPIFRLVLNHQPNCLIRYWKNQNERELLTENGCYGFDFILNERILDNDRIMSHYWKCTDEKRIEIVLHLFRNADSAWQPHQPILNLLSKLSPQMLKRVLGDPSTRKKLLERFLKDVFQVEYFLQLVSLVREEIAADFDFIPRMYSIFFALEQSNCSLVYHEYIRVFDKFCDILKIDIAQQLVHVVHWYFRVIRWEYHFNRVRDIASRFDDETRKELLTLGRHVIVHDILFRNQLEYLKKFWHICLRTEAQIRQHKERFMELEGAEIVSGHFCHKVAQFEEFIQWLTENDEKKMEKFKRSVLFTGFDLILEEMERKYSSPVNFTPLDSFLNWARSNVQVRILKFEIGKECIQRKRNDRFYKELIYWLFENDKEKMKELRRVKYSS